MLLMLGQVAKADGVLIDRHRGSRQSVLRHPESEVRGVKADRQCIVRGKRSRWIRRQRRWWRWWWDGVSRRRSTSPVARLPQFFPLTNRLSPRDGLHQFHLVLGLAAGGLDAQTVPVALHLRTDRLHSGLRHDPGRTPRHARPSWGCSEKVMGIVQKGVGIVDAALFGRE